MAGTLKVGEAPEGLQAEPAWEKPVPLRSTVGESEYPMDYLPDIIGSAVYEVAQATQAPIAMISASALSVVSTCVQGFASVERDKTLRGPISLFFLTVADSGERKTTCDSYFSKELREWEAAQDEIFAPKFAEYAAEEKAWKATDSGFQDAFRKAAKDGAPAKIDQRYLEHELAKPKPPRKPEILRIDDTPEAMALALARWPIASVMSAEAGIIFGSHSMNPDSVMRNLSQMNIFWEGGRLKRSRTTTHSVDIEGMRVTAGLQVQPAVLSNFMGKSGDLAKGIGYYSRFLFSHPDSTQGTRFYREPTQGSPALAAFNARVREVLSWPVDVDDDGRLYTPTLTLEPEAKNTWIKFYNNVEEELHGRGYFHDIRDVASKAAENATRLAACFHIFAAEPGTPALVISDDHMLRAVALMRYYLEEALRFAQLTKVPEAVLHAEILENWLKENYLARNDNWDLELKFGPGIPTRVISQRGPNTIRQPVAKRDAAIAVLEDHYRIKVFSEIGKTSKFLVPNPALLADWARDL